MGNSFPKLYILYSYISLSACVWVARNMVHTGVVIHSRLMIESVLVITGIPFVEFSEEEERLFYSMEVAGISTGPFCKTGQGNGQAPAHKPLSFRSCLMP